MENTDNLIPPGEFEVEKILDYRKITKIDTITKKKYEVEEYLIKWLGYDEQSWEPLSNLDNCKILLNEFKKKMKKKIPSKRRKKNCKSKISLNVNKSTKKVYKRLLRSKENITEITKIPKSCLKIQKPKKARNSKKYYLLQNKSFNAIKTKSEKINLKEEKVQKAKTKEKKDIIKPKISNTDKNTNNNENFDKNRYVLYRCEIIEKPIFFDFNNIIIEQKNNYDKITFNEIFPDDNFDKMENILGKKRKRNNSLFSSSCTKNGVNNNFISPRGIKK